MTFSHLHLMLNHVPVVGLPIALAFLVYGLRIHHLPVQRFALAVLVMLAAVALPVYLTGEPAEKTIEHLPEFSESFIEPHEDAALFSLILTLTSGVAAIAALWFIKNETQGRKLVLSVTGVTLAAVISLGYTAYLGGQVRHTELRSGFAPPMTGDGQTEPSQE